MSIRDDFFAAKAKGSLWDVAVSIKRGNPLPLDADSIFESYAALEAYAADVLAYPGQVVAVVNADSTGIYYLDQNLAIQPVGVVPAGDGLSVVMDDNDVISLHNYGKAYYKYVAEVKDEETGETVSEARYEKVTVGEAIEEGSEEVYAWKAGLEPKVVTEGGKLVIGWYEPNPTTIEGVNDQVTAVQGTVADLELSVGVPSAEGQEATGLYKEVEDVQEDVENLTSVVGTSEDALGENVDTLWAHVNDHEGRIDALEDIDHSVYALKTALEQEAKDRAAADEALGKRIDAIDFIDETELATALEPYAKSADVSATYETIAEADKVRARVKNVEDTYLKAADKYDDTEIRGLIGGNSAAIGVLEGEVDVLNGNAQTEGSVDYKIAQAVAAIMNNPDGTMDSIQELVDWVNDHAGDALELSNQVSTNKADIATLNGLVGTTKVETQIADAIVAALKVEGVDKYALATELAAAVQRIVALEGINHDAYKAADEALSAALTAEINKKQDIIPAETYDAYGAAAAAEAAAKGHADTVAATAKSEAISEAATAAAGLYATQTRVNDLETALDGRLDKLEAYDHATYATKAELNAHNEAAAAAYATKDELKATDDKAVSNSNSITNLTNRLDGIVAQGGEPNTINTIKVNGVAQTIDGEKAVDIAVPTTIAGLSDWAAVDGRITAAKAQADKGVTDAGVADAKAVENAAAIQGHETRLAAVEGHIGNAESGLLKDVADLKAHDLAHGAEFNALSGTVGTHGTDIAGLKTGKADVSVVEGVSAKAAANEQAIKTLNETTIPGINTEIGKKANADAVYTKTEIGTLDEGKTLVEMIDAAKAAATYNDSEVRGLIAGNTSAINAIYKAGEGEAAATGLLPSEIARVEGLITAEESRAKGVEKNHEDRIAEMETFWAAADDPEGTIDKLAEIVNYIAADKTGALDMAGDIAANTAAIAAIYTPASGEGEEAVAASGVLVTEIARVEGKADANAQAIAAINNETTGILAVAKKYADDQIAGIPAATAEALGLVKYDNKTIGMNASQQLYVKEVSTDVLVQGELELILNGGTAV